MMTDKLKPCPFCWGEAEKYAKEIKGIKILTVTCKRCGASGQLFQSKKPRIKDEENPAIKAWNSRKSMDRIVEQLDANYKQAHSDYKDTYNPYYEGQMLAYDIAEQIVKEGGSDE